jgi:hypothetical protein
LKARTYENVRLTHTGILEAAEHAGGWAAGAVATTGAARMAASHVMGGKIAEALGLSTLGQASQTLLVGSAHSTIAPGSAYTATMFAEGAVVFAVKSAVVGAGWLVGVGIGSVGEALYDTAFKADCEW